MRIQNDIYAFRACVVNGVINVTKFGSTQSAVHDRLNALQKKRKSDRRETFRSEIVDFGVCRVCVVVINSLRSTGPVLGSRNIDSKNTKSRHSISSSAPWLRTTDSFAELTGSEVAGSKTTASTMLVTQGF